MNGDFFSDAKVNGNSFAVTRWPPDTPRLSSTFDPDLCFCLMNNAEGRNVIYLW